ncbi:MAG: hypothetical protein ACXAC6_14455 [Candidatus Hodarchaeales archaeon]|jgi:multimeric flavodoxin WrbA
MTRTVLLTGSPRGKKSTSASINNFLESLFKENGLESTNIMVRSQISSDEKLSKMLDVIEESETLILTAPLYDDCQPFPVTKLMESIGNQKRDVKGKVFIPIINCGFAESNHITAVSLSIYRRFVHEMGMKWGGSIAIGAGEGLEGRRGKQLNELGGLANRTRETLERMVDTLAAGNQFSDEVIEVLPKIFRGRLLGWFFIWLNNRGWKSMAKKHGQKVDTRPYSQ